MTQLYPEIPGARWLAEGYAVGTTDAGTWLTVIGSYNHGATCILPTREDAERVLASRPDWLEWSGPPVIIARVKRTPHAGCSSGEAYRILPEATA